MARWPIYEDPWSLNKSEKRHDMKDQDLKPRALLYILFPKIIDEYV